MFRDQRICQNPSAARCDMFLSESLSSLPWTAALDSILFLPQTKSRHLPKQPLGGTSSEHLLVHP